MLPDLQSALLCDDVRQEKSGKFILIGLFDSLGAPQFPFRQPRLFIVSRWCSGEGEFLQRTRIVAPDLQTVVAESRPIPVRLADPEASATNVELFMNVEFATPGTHWIEVLLGDDLKIRFPLRVLKVRRPAPPSGAQEP